MNRTLLSVAGLRVAGLAALAASWITCGDDTSPPPGDDGTAFVFDLGADLHDPAKFYDAPYPSDLRLSADGHPDLAGLPNPSNVETVASLAASAAQAKGFPVVPVTYFRFTRALSPRSADDVIAADPSSPILIVDIDPDSPNRGTLVPAIAETLVADPYTAENVLGVAPRPGFVLHPGTEHAVVVLKSANDAAGKPLAANEVLERLKARAPEGDKEAAADTLYAPLWETLTEAGVDVGAVAAATVFTTGTVVAETAATGDALLDKYEISIDDLAFDDTELYDELCVLRGKVTLPQFQVGTPDYDTDGLFEFGPDGLPVEQRTEDAPIAIVIPRTPMPDGGYPLILNIHGSGGFSIAMVRPVGDDGVPGDPIGPAFPNATKGIATAGMAMPLNPERLPGAGETAYLNVNNLAAVRDTFRQGIFEARMFLETVSKLQIDPALLTACTGATLPAGKTKFSFDGSKLVIMGQSMGGMYTNLIGATEPRLTAAVPTGAGGYWSYFLLVTPLRDGGIPALLSLLLNTTVKLSLMHPVLSIGEAAVEAADPIVYMPHLARRPLPDHPTRPIYEPVGLGDSYFPTTIYDAVAVAYGHQEAGDVAWPTMQEALALEGRDGLIDFPVTNNLTNEDGAEYTGVVAQFEGDGTYDPHAIYSHRDDVKRQYSCFLDSFLKTGVATVPELSTDWHAACP